MSLPPTDLEEAAIALHDFLWETMGMPESPMEISGDDERCDRVVELLNKLQEEIIARNLDSWDYRPKS